VAWSRGKSGAVFLSYASQDADAAPRICDALRAAGVEVWFDQSELRGGDSWDQKIRRQIRECALFIPVISANTQSRSEGYFRREWKLGVERTHDMADHVAFLVPVVLDGTSDREAQVQAAEKGGTRDAAAHELYLQGLYYMRQFKTESFVTAEEKFRNAVKLDPSYALAWAALSTTLSHEWAWATVASPEVIVECHDAARRALALEPNLSEGYDALFGIQTSYDLDLASAAVSARKGLELAPDDANSLANSGILALGYGNLDRGIGLLNRAISLDPLNTDFRIFLSNALASVGRTPEAYAELQNVLAFNPDASLVRGFMASMFAIYNYRLPDALAIANDEKAEWSRLSAQALVLSALKRTPEADAALSSLIEKCGNIAAFQVAEIYGFRRENNKAFEWLERAYRQHDGGIGWIKSDEALVPLHEDSRWAPFLRKIHFSDPEPD
jgi:tetratricopeptide (TPR) repeat protein